MTRYSSIYKSVSVSLLGQTKPTLNVPYFLGLTYQACFPLVVVFAVAGLENVAAELPEPFVQIEAEPRKGAYEDAAAKRGVDVVC